ncbi:uncharacterized protein LOC118455926 [Neolamprologus brichardi]|uniref:uncharacterized protein LOC118455926 n=1 Tax=Neolamprologus brichardi TaxID=32507 RepID=UPI001643A627|nr:uncharacterized protein LOC118455926 [Neolamprologus brichardi]
MFSCHVWFLLSGLIGCTENSTAIWFSVPENHHLCLPCGSSDVIWTLQDQEVLVTRRGGYETNKDRRRYLLMVNGGLCVLHLEESDHGRYRCNQQLVAELQVLTVLFSVIIWVQTFTRSLTFKRCECVTSVCVLSFCLLEVGEIKKKSTRPENVLLLVAVVGVGLMIVFLAAVCVLLTSMKCRRKKRRAAGERREDTELQPWTASSVPTEGEDSETPPLCGETIHYASLGRQNWRERPSRSPPEQSHHSVIYSVISRPAARAEHGL